MLGLVSCWVGIDVGGKRKGFDVAVIDERRLVTLAGRVSRDAVVEIVDAEAPLLIGIDSPVCWAPDGQSTRAGERLLNKAVCGIRWTPDAQTGSANSYYEWIREGLALFTALTERGAQVIEVFPTASWTRWQGSRATSSRAHWSRAGLRALGLGGLPARTNQDQRDAVAAAVTARQHSMGMTEVFGETVVPR